MHLYCQCYWTLGSHHAFHCCWNTQVRHYQLMLLWQKRIIYIKKKTLCIYGGFLISFISAFDEECVHFIHWKGFPLKPEVRSLSGNLSKASSQQPCWSQCMQVFPLIPLQEHVTVHDVLPLQWIYKLILFKICHVCIHSSYRLLWRSQIPEHAYSGQDETDFS